MGRILSLTIDVYPPNDSRPLNCVEVFRRLRSGPKNRVLHFGIGNPMRESDVEFICEVIEAELRTDLGSTLGIQTQLEF